MLTRQQEPLVTVSRLPFRGVFKRRLANALSVTKCSKFEIRVRRLPARALTNQILCSKSNGGCKGQRSECKLGQYANGCSLTIFSVARGHQHLKSLEKASSGPLALFFDPWALGQKAPVLKASKPRLTKFDLPVGPLNPSEQPGHHKIGGIACREAKLVAR